ncbi:MAG: hypothetical protein ABIT20_07475 [Gemmatimonadaceae bacterium]
MIPKDHELGLAVRVKYVDVEVGCGTFDRAIGLAYTTLQPSSAYPMIAPFARGIGDWLAVRHDWRPTDGDIADIVGEQWRGERLCLADHLGRELAVSHVIVVERRRAPYNGPLIQLVADFRPAHTRVAAVVPAGDKGSGGYARPTGC